MSLAGGMDLSKLRAVESDRNAAVSVASWVTAVNEASLPALVKLSSTVPVLVEFFEAEPVAELEAVVRSKAGKLVLGRIDTKVEPRVVQAFGVKATPSLFALVKGQPVAVAESALTENQYLAVIDQLIAAAEAQGVAGRAVEGNVAEVPELPKPLQEALLLVDSGEIDKAHEILTKLKAENPKDLPTSALLAQVNLMKRTMDLEHEKILDSQPKTFDEAIILADVLAAIGDFSSAFNILLSLYTQVQPENQDVIKVRLLEYFEIAGAHNDDVKVARAKLATLLY